MHFFVENASLNCQAKDERPNIIGHALQAKLVRTLFLK